MRNPAQLLLRRARFVSKRFPNPLSGEVKEANALTDGASAFEGQRNEQLKGSWRCQGFKTLGQHPRPSEQWSTAACVIEVFQIDSRFHC